MTTYYHLTHGDILVRVSTGEITLSSQGFGFEGTVHIPEEDFYAFRQIVEEATSAVSLPSFNEGIDAASAFLAETNGSLGPEKLKEVSFVAVCEFLRFMKKNISELVHGDIPPDEKPEVCNDDGRQR